MPGLGKGLGPMFRPSSVLNLPPRTDLITGRWGDSVLGMEIIESSGSYYFKAKTGSNLLITGYDMGSTAIPGWKYKSAATVDIFGETSVPVVSMFENYNYGNQFFCKHKARLLHADGYELFDGIVMEIVEYSTPLTGDDLIKANTYFGVPEKPTSNIREVGSGKTYATIQAAITAATAGDKVLIYSGAYNETSGGLPGVLYFTKSLNFEGLGKVKITSSSVTRNVYATNVNSTWKRVIFDSTDTSATGLEAGTLVTSVEKCYFINFKTDAISANTSTSDVRLKDCIFKAKLTATYATQRITVAATLIEGCYFANATISQSQKDVVIKNNLIYSCDKVSAFNASNVGVVAFGNKLNYSQYGMRSNGLATYTSGKTIDIHDNTFNHGDLSGVGGNGIQFAGNLVASIKNNIINANSATYTTAYIYLISVSSTNANSVNIENNIIYSKSTTPVTHITARGVGMVVKNNYSHCNSYDNTQFELGSEAATTGLNDNAIIEGNRLIGYKVEHPDVGAKSIHALFCGNGINMQIRYNKISDTMLGLAVKTGSSEAYTSGGVYGNVFENIIKSVVAQRITGLKIYGNTFAWNDVAHSSDFVTCIQVAKQSDLLITSNIIAKNNIFSVNSNYGSLFSFDQTGIDNGCIAENSQLFGALYLMTSGATNYSDLATANAAGKLNNCVVGDPSLNASLVPATPFTGADLGADYNTGLDTATTWGSTTTVPAIVTKVQPATWQKGAYIQ